MIAIFGAGNMGVRALAQIGKSKVGCFIDNNKKGELLGVPIKSMDEFKADSRYADHAVVIPSQKFRDEMEDQLNAEGVDNYICFTPDKITKKCIGGVQREAVFLLKNGGFCTIGQRWMHGLRGYGLAYSPCRRRKC